jgi:hypothetical protein
MDKAVRIAIWVTLKVIAVYSFALGGTSLFYCGYWLLDWYQSEPADDYRDKHLSLSVLCFIFSVACIVIGRLIWKLSTPQPRMTTRRWMIAVAVLAVVLAAWKALERLDPLHPPDRIIVKPGPRLVR